MVGKYDWQEEEKEWETEKWAYELGKRRDGK